MASVGAGEQVSGTPFSSRPFSDDNGRPCSVGQLVAGWGGSQAVFSSCPKVNSGNPKGLARHDFILLSQQPWEALGSHYPSLQRKKRAQRRESHRQLVPVGTGWATDCQSSDSQSEGQLPPRHPLPHTGAEVPQSRSWEG